MSATDRNCVPSVSSTRGPCPAGRLPHLSAWATRPGKRWAFQQNASSSVMRMSAWPSQWIGEPELPVDEVRRERLKGLSLVAGPLVEAGNRSAKSTSSADRLRRISHCCRLPLQGQDRGPIGNAFLIERRRGVRFRIARYQPDQVALVAKAPACSEDAGQPFAVGRQPTGKSPSVNGKVLDTGAAFLDLGTDRRLAVFPTPAPAAI